MAVAPELIVRVKVDDVIDHERWNELIDGLNDLRAKKEPATPAMLAGLALTASASQKRFTRRSLFGWMLGDKHGR